MKLIEYTSRDAVMQGVAQALGADLGAALAAQGQVTLAVPGGTTPGPAFDLLAALPLDWGRVHVLLTDERWVPQSDPASNAALIRARLMQGPAAAARFTPYYDADADIAQAAARLSGALAHVVPIDVMLLGMGADMHTASLFPGAQGLEAALAPDAPLLLPVRPQGQDVARFSLSAPALRSARACHLLITGEDKRAALARAQDLPEHIAPVRTILDKATVHWSAS